VTITNAAGYARRRAIAAQINTALAAKRLGHRWMRGGHNRDQVGFEPGRHQVFSFSPLSDATDG